jgi:O-antigen/teichoic acid export membrane protein
MEWIGAETVPVGTVAGRKRAADTAPELSALTRRASLTAGAALVDYAAKVVVGLVLTPILVSQLGRALFGTWEMLTRLVGYVTTSDGRPTEALRLVIAQGQVSAAGDAKRRTVGAALAVWVLMLPVALIGGVVLILVAPTLAKVPEGVRTDVRLCVALLIATSLATALASVPESVLRGSNLGYKRMGWQAALNLVGGGLAAMAAVAGFGLAGLGGSQVIRAAAAGVLFWLLVRAHVSWFGLARPALAEVRSLFGMSAWLIGGDVIAKAVLASDVVILGAVVDPTQVTTYVLTGYAARLAVGIHVFTAGAAIPGLGGMLGAGQFTRAAHARRELVLLTWLFVTAVGATILLWNREFLTLWVGPENYAGAGVQVLIVVIAAQTAFIRVDAFLLDAALRPRARVLVGAGAAVLTIGLGIVLTRAFGVVGLCAAVLTGRAVQSVAYPLLARNSLGARHGASMPAADAARLAVVTGTLFVAAAWLSDHVTVSGWMSWILGVSATLPTCALIALAAGPNAAMRHAITRRMAAAARSVRKP